MLNSRVENLEIFNTVRSVSRLDLYLVKSYLLSFYLREWLLFGCPVLILIVGALTQFAKQSCAFFCTWTSLLGSKSIEPCGEAWLCVIQSNLDVRESKGGALGSQVLLHRSCLDIIS